MASKYARKILNNTPKELRNFVMYYGNMVVRCYRYSKYLEIKQQIEDDNGKK